MNQTAYRLEERATIARRERVFHLVLSVPTTSGATQRIREVIARKRGDLRALSARPQRRQVHVHVGLRRVDDVVAALEGAGFGIDAVIATPQRPESPTLAGGRVTPINARSSNL